MKKLDKSKYIHYQRSAITSGIGEIVFGMQDGMVSTLGALTGIAIGSNSQSIVILAGLVIIAVESISMATGTYLSSKSIKEIEARMLDEEKEEIKHETKAEIAELAGIYIKTALD